MQKIDFSQSQRFSSLPLALFPALFACYLGCHDVGDEGIMHIALHCSSLRSLTLSGCERITDQSAKHLGTGLCSPLRLLTSPRIFFFQRTGVLSFNLFVCPTARVFPTRRSAFCQVPFAVSNTSLIFRVLSASCPALSTLHLSACDEITDIACQSIASNSFAAWRRF